MRVILLGDGGHGKVIREMIAHEVIGILDDKYEVAFSKEGTFYGPISSIEQLIDTDVKVVIGIGNNKIRKRLTEMLGLKKEQYVSVVHASAIVSPTASIGTGTVVMANAVINTGTTIGAHCIINTGAIVEHDNDVEHFTHVSPNAALTGDVTVGEGVNIGASATVIPGKEIGDWATIGAGSTVIKDIPAHSKAVGSPARIIEQMAVER